MDKNRTKFSLIFASWFTFAIFAFGWLLLSPLFTALETIQFLLAVILFNPQALIFVVPVLFFIGFIIGEIFYPFLPWYRELKYKKSILIIIVVLFSLFLAYQNRINSQPNYYTYTETDCKNISKTWNTSKYISKEYCFHEVAKRTKDPSVCNNLGLGEETKGTYTKSFCLEEVARYKNDPSVCELITDGRKETCYYQMKVCEKLTSESLKLRCLSSRAWIEEHPNGY